MKKVLLHICCASCATVCVARLKKEGFGVYGLFYNPNIHPLQEHKKRAEDIKILSKKNRFKVLGSKYNPQDWFEFVKGYENENEGGRRCSLCFEFRLKQTYNVMLKYKFQFFTTTLTISPHKDTNVINEIGRSLSQDAFLEKDFKKQDGFKESVVISKTLGFHRQNYCGCIYSKRH